MISAVSLVKLQKAQSLSKQELPQTTHLKASENDTFKKQKKLNAICALTDGFSTPVMA